MEKKKTEKLLIYKGPRGRLLLDGIMKLRSLRYINIGTGSLRRRTETSGNTWARHISCRGMLQANDDDDVFFFMCLLSNQRFLSFSLSIFVQYFPPPTLFFSSLAPLPFSFPSPVSIQFN